MSATEIPSGRGRLRMPGMGQTVPEQTAAMAPPAPSETAEEPTTPPAATAAASEPAPPQARQRRRAPSSTGVSGPAAKPSRDTTSTPKPGTKTLDGPYAGEKKAQVNPRIYPSIWTHYEDLVDELPRHQRHGALTALVNAVLAQHAPGTPEDALEAIQWLRHAETRERPA